MAQPTATTSSRSPEDTASSNARSMIPKLPARSPFAYGFIAITANFGHPLLMVMITYSHTARKLVGMANIDSPICCG